ncbi:site-specific integrase [Clostridium cadaveris]|uniref:site-specific integrase n=1 Tax=Clostridium cadaveris TaxID=1529 RepID=UPI00041A7AC1|nr:site-specific integrase [Clostridium cadaveris]MDY4950830.1 tyrosine-type recombinase/integrase [Clostridium cadaveris]NME64417.1 site-specific integrase [Clostridium cadaveris]
MATVNVTKRGSKWQYSFEGAKIEGKRNRISKSGFRTKKEALEAGTAALAEYNNAGLHFEPKNISVSDYMDYWYEHYVLLNCKYNTQKNYKMIIETHIKPTLGIYALKSLTPSILQEFVNSKFKDGYSKNYLSNLINVLSSSLKYSVHPYKFIKDNPMQYIRPPKYEYSKLETNHKIISADDFKRILNRFPLGSSFYISLMLGYYTGCRIGEVMGLTWDDINFEDSTVNINKILYKRESSMCFGSTKTSSSVRTIKIGETLVNALRLQKKWQLENRLKYGEHFIQQYKKTEVIDNTEITRIYSSPLSLNMPLEKVNFVNTKENGEFITSESFKYASRIIHHELGIVFNFHSLRHTHATILIENGANIKDVQTRLGHAKIETTLDTYTHDTEQMSNESVNIFEKAAKK